MFYQLTEWGVSGLIAILLSGFVISLLLATVTGSIFPCNFMCFRNELGCVYVLLQPSTLQTYGLSDVCTWLCFLRSLLFANRLPHPSNSQMNGFSPTEIKNIINNLLLGSISESFERHTALDRFLSLFFRSRGQGGRFDYICFALNHSESLEE